jgi:hypothetical protein
VLATLRQLPIGGTATALAFNGRQSLGAVADVAKRVAHQPLPILRIA